LTVFRPYKQISSSERQSNHREKLQRSQVNNMSDSKQPESLRVVVPEHNKFPPDVPDALLRRKIISDFCAATQPSKFEEAGCAVCGSLTLKLNFLI